MRTFIFRYHGTDYRVEAANVNDALDVCRREYSAQFNRHAYLVDVEGGSPIEHYLPKNRSEKAATALCLLAVLAMLLFLLHEYFNV